MSFTLVVIAESFELELHFLGVEYKGQKMNSKVLSKWGI